MPIDRSVILGEKVIIYHSDQVNLYGCSIGDETKIGSFVEIQKNVFVGSKCKISSHSFICEGVQIEDGVFIGHGVMFINDRFPEAMNASGILKDEDDWTLEPTIVQKGVSIGSNATIMCGVTIGENALIGAGSVVVKDVLPNAVVAGVPAQVIQNKRE